MVLPVSPDLPSPRSFRARSLNLFGRRRVSEKKQQKEDIGISFISLKFSVPGLEERYKASRRSKFRYRLRFGAAFTSFFIPLLVIMQISFKADDQTNAWSRYPLVMVFPGIVFLLGLSVTFFLDFFQRNSRLLSLLCLVGQISALLDTTAAGTSVSERNVWVQFIFSLGITSSTGLTVLESQFVSATSSLFFIALSWIRYSVDVDTSRDECTDELSLSSPGTSMAAVVLYSILLGFLAWNWEFEERRDFILTERLAQENVKVQMTMEMTGWFSGGAAESGEDGGILSKNCHIDPKDVEIYEELGSGTFGSVYSAMWKETKVAVKKLNLVGDTQKIMTSFGAEATLMAQLRHPNVVMFMGVMVHAEFVGVIMELCPKGSVYGILKQEQLVIDWSLSLRMMLDAARGLNFLHCNSPPILHRDLKSLNLLIDADWRCKVSDFGLSKLRSRHGTEHSPQQRLDSTNEINATVGTAVWLAPEIFVGETHTEASDVYSYGIILYEMLTRSLPYDSISTEAIPFVVQAGKRPTDFHDVTVTNVNLIQVADLMRACWATNPRDRPVFTSIISTLQTAVVNYIDKEPWEDNIIFPDRSTLAEMRPAQRFSIEENDLQVGEKIGKGVFGAVYEGTYFGTPVAIKKLFISGVGNDVLKDFEKECSIMQGLRHPNIVLFMGSCSNPPNLLLVTELLVEGSFFDIYHKRPKPPVKELLDLALSITLDMAKGLAYLHNHDPVIIHRDLKSQNIMLDEKMTTKIGDFGLSKFREIGKTMSICGSPLWVAPEVLRGEKYGCACDVYSFAVIAWEALKWSEPYPDMGSSEVMNGVACGSLRPSAPPDAPDELVDVLERCWSTNPDIRPSFDDLVPLLQSIRSSHMQ